MAIEAKVIQIKAWTKAPRKRAKAVRPLEILTGRACGQAPGFGKDMHFKLPMHMDPHRISQERIKAVMGRARFIVRMTIEQPSQGGGGEFLYHGCHSKHHVRGSLT
jgi:hypothetical protein